MYAEYTQLQLTFLSLHPCNSAVQRCFSIRRRSLNVYWTQTYKQNVKNVRNIIEYHPGIEMFSLENAVQFVYILQYPAEQFIYILRKLHYT